MSEEVSPESVDPGSASNPDLQDSELAWSTDASEDDGWFGGIGSDIRSIAACFKNTVPPAIGGVASLVKKTAMSVAAEIAELEREGELRSRRWEDDEEPDSLPLPWEIQQEDESCDNIPVYITDEELMEAILALSLTESTFLEPHSSEDDDETFVLSAARIECIQRLLDIDENLAAIHARLSGRSNVREDSFWKNYFLRCEDAKKELMERRSQESFDQNSSPLSDGAKICSAVLTSDLDSSRVLAESTVGDSSFVQVASAPNSMDTFMSLKSLEEDMVLVEQHK